jgi:hypothetical protein
MGYAAVRRVGAFFNWNMAIDPNAVLDLLNALEFLLIENAVYESSIKVIQRLLPADLPPDTYELVQKAVQAAQADPATRERVHGTFAALRGQLQSATTLEQVIEELLRVLPTKTGPLN